MGGTHYFVLRRGWADICNIAAFYHQKVPTFTLSQPLHTNTPGSTADSCEVQDCRWRHVVGVHRHRTLVTKQIMNRNHKGTHHCNSSGTVIVELEGNTVGHVPRELSRACWYFLARNNTIICKVRDKRQRSNANRWFQEKDPACMRLANLG